ncbi:hypothetical protein ACHAWF_015028 [Thalassiosira exigua]
MFTTMNASAAAAIPAVATGKVNPILKKDPHHHPSSESAGASSAARGADGKATTSSPGKEQRHLTWDEHAIEEHDQLRGTRMKIDEPNTPYTHYDHSDGEESHSSVGSGGRHPRSPDENHPEHGGPSLATQWGDVASKLQAVADKRDATSLSPAPSRESDDEETRKKHDKFKDMRKKHYNEAEAMRRWKAEHANDDDEDDDDDKMEE